MIKFIIEWITNNKKTCVLEVDINGARSIYKSGLFAYFIGIFPPNISVLRERLNKRGTENVEQINKTLKIAYKEVEDLTSLNILNSKIVNDDLEIAYSQLKNIVLSLYPEFK